MLAHTFNRLYAHTGESVGKTFVNDLQRQHRAAIALKHRALKRRPFGPGPKNRVWGLDLTGKTDAQENTHWILGILDHGSRANLALAALPGKATINILHLLLDAVKLYGTPKYIRTDNEAIFQSRLFKLVLRLLGIRHQGIDKHSPWQNGRIERFFGTLKAKLNQWTVPDQIALNTSLQQFQFWYNTVRPHQHLHGKTPAEVWAGVDVFHNPRRKAKRFEAWDGLLKGYYLE